MRVLITGGAGFIGSRLAKRLGQHGATVTVIDSLSEQIHGPRASFPVELAQAARCIQGDVCDRELLSRELGQQDVVVHFAAETGTGQSMYAIQRYERTNVQGTATLLDVIVNERPQRLAKLVVASSRAIYGEGKYECREHGVVYPGARSSEAMSAGRFEPECSRCGRPLEVLPTTEDTPFAPSSFYGLTKQVQEQMVLMFGGTLRLDAVALRYQNVYGPGQSLGNPYTGLLAVFCNLVRQGKSLQVFEDGQESRDFVFVEDVVEATMACMAPDIRGIHALNVGSGARTSVLEVARAVKAFFRADVSIEITGRFRAGDIRHNVADVSQLRALTGYVPKWRFEDGLREFLEWARSSQPAEAGFERSLAELAQRGLLGGG